MKYLFIVLSILLTKNSCDNKTQSDNISLEYSAISRGIYKMITIEKEKVTLQDKRNGELKTKVCTEDDWKSLMQAYKDIEAKSISELQAPTDKRLYDGAAIGQLVIKINGKSYTSSSFDDGHPPKEIEALVKEILSIAQNIE